MNNGKMKRLLALMLCVTQLVGFVPHVHADEETPGEAVVETTGETGGETEGETGGETEGETTGETEGETTGETEDETTGETEGETTGETEGETTGETEGETTGETEGETTGETEGETMGETGDENAVEPMSETEGDTTACEHPDSLLTEPDENNRFKKNQTVKNITETEHTRVYEVWGYFTCECGVTGLERQITAEGSTTEPHEFHNGVCVVDGCGYECPHTDKTWMESGYSDNFAYTDNGDGTHQEEYDSYLNYECDACEETIHEFQGRKERVQAHFFNDGLCACGAQEPSCEHQNQSFDMTTKTETVYTGEYAQRTEGSSPSPAQAHDKLFFCTANRVCDDCGVIVEVNAPIEGGEPEEHTFVDGKCVCGYEQAAEPACEHNNRIFDMSTKTDMVYTGEYAQRPEGSNPSPAQAHDKLFTCKADMLCHDCGALVEAQAEVSGGEPEEHTFVDGKCVCGAEGIACEGHIWNEDKSGLCTLCGVECAHTERWWYEESLTDMVINSTRQLGEDEPYQTRHLINFTAVGDEYCEICLKTTKTGKTITANMSAPHDWEDGVCTGCGYACEHSIENGECTICGVKSCQHPNAEYAGSGVQSDNWENRGDAKYHFGMGYTFDVYYCGDCDSYIDYFSDVLEEQKEEHRYPDGTDTCEACGYVNTCVHENVDEWTDYALVDGEEWTVSADGHTGLTIERFNYSCLDCGDFWREFGETSINTFGHDYYEGICMDCGYENTCEHEKVDSWTHFEPVEGESWKDNGDGTHYANAYAHYCTECRDCGEYTDVRDENAQLVYTEHHFEDSVCRDCGAEGCKHPNGEFAGNGVTLLPGERWEDRGDHLFHYGIGYHTDVYYCPDCDAYYDIQIGEAEEVQATHWYEDGSNVCNECGHENTCEHPNLDGWMEYELVEGEEWEITEDSHTGLIVEVNCFYCPDCDMYWREADDASYVETIRHNFYEGVCDTCGYENTCEHPNVDSWTHYEPVEGEVWKDNGDGTHYANAYLHHCWECRDCHEINDVREETAQLSYAKHWFEDGVCPECGAENTCTHERTDTWEHHENISEKVAVDATSHAFTADVYQLTWCFDCESEVDRTLIGEGMDIVENHYFYNDVCEECGFESLCDHAEVEEHEWYQILGEATVVDEKTHTGEFRHVIEKWCLICSEMIGETVIEESVEHTEEHYFFDGVCDACGYENSCEHKETATEVWIGDEKNPAYIDQYTHRVTAIEYTEAYCVECGEWMTKDRIEKEITIIQNHRLNSDGICVICGEAGTACEHKNLEISDYDHMVSQWEPYDHEKCFWVSDVYRETWCKDCNQLLDEELISAGEIRYEEHVSDDGDSLCDMCGYDMNTPTPKPTPKPEEDDVFVPTPKPNNNNNNYRPAPTVEPTVEPTAEPTVEPTAEPAAPVAGETEMVTTLIQTVEAVEEEGATVTVEIVGAEEVFTEETYDKLNALPVSERILVTLSTIGFGDVVEAAMTSMNATLSEDAAQLVEETNAAKQQMTSEEIAQMEEAIKKSFPKRQVQIDGVVYDYFILELEITVDGVTRIESFGFRYDEELGQWIFVNMDTLEADGTV